MYRERLRELNLGLEDRLTTKVGLLSGGQRQAVTLLMASLRSRGCCCSTSTPPRSTPQRRRRCWSFPTASCRKTVSPP